MLAAGLAGCSSAPPTTASVDDFCGAMSRWWKVVESTDLEAGAAAIDRLRDVGTPAGAPREAQRHVATLSYWLDEAGPEPSNGPWVDLSVEEREDYVTFDAWAQTTCASGEVAAWGASPLG